MPLNLEDITSRKTTSNVLRGSYVNGLEHESSKGYVAVGTGPTFLQPSLFPEAPITVGSGGDDQAGTVFLQSLISTAERVQAPERREKGLPVTVSRTEFLLAI